MTLKNVKKKKHVNYLKKSILISFIFLFCFTPFSKAQFIGQDSNKISICDSYEQFRDWLPDAYIYNAGCACNYLPKDSAAMAIRIFLIESAFWTNPALQSEAREMKNKYLADIISYRKYKKFVRKKIAPKIYSDHVLAYRFAGCTKGPAPFWEFRYSCIHPFRHCKRMLQLNLMFGGSCKKTRNSW
jgi:hypothetical protein